MMIHDAVIAYEAIYVAVVRLIGLDMTLQLTERTREDLDKGRPLESIKEFLHPLESLLGKPSLRSIVEGALEKHFVPGYVEEIVGKLDLET